MGQVKFSRYFAMPSPDTFQMGPVGSFVLKYLAESKCSVDPFARNNKLATFTNDLNPNTSAKCHMDAEAFCHKLWSDGVEADLGFFDPPYSPRQVSEHYRAAGVQPGRDDTQNGRLYRRVRDALDKIIQPNGIVLSFGWNSTGMGKARGYTIIEISLISHGAAHNDTICLAERKNPHRNSA